MVNLFLGGKPRSEIIREYDLTPSSIDTWLKQSNVTGSFKKKDNRSAEENELVRLQKENQQLKMENDFSNQAYGTRRIKAVCSEVGVSYQGDALVELCAIMTEYQSIDEHSSRFISNRVMSPRSEMY